MSTNLFISCRGILEYFLKHFLAKWEGKKSGGVNWQGNRTYCWLSVCSLSCLSEQARVRLGSNIIIDTFKVDYADSADATAIAEMFLVLQLGTCGQFVNRGTIVLINFPYVLLRYSDVRPLINSIIFLS